MIYSKNAAYFNIRKSVNIICYISKLKEGKNMLVTVYAHKAFANTAAEGTLRQRGLENFSAMTRSAMNLLSKPGS